MTKQEAEQKALDYKHLIKTDVKLEKGIFNITTINESKDPLNQNNHIVLVGLANKNPKEKDRIENLDYVLRYI